MSCHNQSEAERLRKHRGGQLLATG